MYKIFFFLHFLAAIIMFSAVGINFVSMSLMAFSKEIKFIRKLSYWTVKMGKVLAYSIMLVLVSSLYMVFSNWSWEEPWIVTAFFVLIVITVTWITIDLPRLKSINKDANAEKAVTPTIYLMGKILDRVLWNSVSIMTMEVAAIIHIMIEKLGTVGSLITIAIGLVLGLILSKIILIMAHKYNPAMIKDKTVDF